MTQNDDDDLPVYAYLITFEYTGTLTNGELETRQTTVEIDAIDASHAFSEANDDDDIWPDETTLISIVRGEPRGYTQSGDIIK